MMQSKVSLWVVAAMFSVPAMLSACAGGPGPEQKTQAVAQSASSNVCPSDNAEYKSSVDVTLDHLSVEELTTLADTGRTDAMVLLALRYGPASDGNESDKRPAPDMEKAVALLQKAADKQNADAEFLMGTVYINGLGVPKDEAKAASWFARGARHGNAMAQFWYGEMTAKGRGGIAADWKAALPHFQGAAQKGVNDAFLELGYMYFNGYGGLEVDPQKAAFCYRRIMAKSPLAQFNLRRLIEEEKIVWQPGDPGKPLEKPQAPPAN
jgi:TPR repeat protein